MSDVKPWELRTESTRASDTIYNFIIFCEDEVSEPAYLRQFEGPNIKIEFFTNKKSTRNQYLFAFTQLDEKGQVDYANGKPTGLKFDDGTQVWCIYDRDRASLPSNLSDSDFTTSISNTENLGIKVAWSNDAFELWILLHFEDVNAEDEEYKARTKYYERLTDIFKTMPEPNEHLKNRLIHPTFSYKKDLKSGKNEARGGFTQIVLPAIKDKIADAIARAKNLESHHAAKDKYHEMAPCTKMHTLVEELVNRANEA